MAALLLFAAGAAGAQAPGPRPSYKVRDLGVASPSVSISATVHLPLADQKGFDDAVAARYDEKSPLFHKWMSEDEIIAFGPSHADVKAVKQALAGFGLTVTEVSDDGSDIDVSGPPAAMQQAFGVRIHTLSVGGRMTYGAISAPQPQGQLAGRVRGVTGLSGAHYRPMIRYQLGADGKPVKGIEVGTDASPLDNFTNQCFTASTNQTFTDGSNTAAISGVGYTLDGRLCGYTPAQMLQHYGVDQIHTQGFYGDGQTIVIIDAFGSPTAMADANTFFNTLGIAPFTRDNFKIVYPHGRPSYIGYGWDGETALDVEWAHVVAPDAKIVLVISPDDSDNNLDKTERYAISRGFGNVVSNSWGEAEHWAGQPEADNVEKLMKHAAAKGISVQFSTGDDGDTLISDGSIGPGFPASAPHATAVGGTSIDVPSTAGPVEMGWGSNRAQVAWNSGQPLYPVIGMFGSGAGGGDSQYFVRAHWQRDIPGSQRHTPDVSMDADPYTGAILVEPDFGGGSVWSVIGGTSLAAPMFSALWAIADQISGCDPTLTSCRGGSSLGLAAALQLQMAQSGALADIAPVTVASPLSGTFSGPGYDGAGQSGTKDGFQILNLPEQADALTVLRYRAVDQSDWVLGFDSDTTLAVTSGWDNVTGRGVPDAVALKNFVHNFTSSHP